MPSEDTIQQEPAARSRPSGMPLQAPPQKGNNLLRGTEKPKDVLPAQKALTDETDEPSKPAKWKSVLLRVVTVVLVVLVLSLMYVFLLLGEPDEDAAYTDQVQQEQIRMPMTAIESPGDSSVSAIAETFGQPVLSLYGSALSMTQSRIYDTAFGGGYARRATLTYTFEDGAKLLVESIRPTGAVTLLRGSGYSLDADTLYAIGGVDAARMDNDQQICVFGQTGNAVYAVTCPKSHAEELETLLKQTALIAAETNP